MFLWSSNENYPKIIPVIPSYLDNSVLLYVNQLHVFWLEERFSLSDQPKIYICLVRQM